MMYTRSHPRPSQKDLGCVVYPLNNKSLEIREVGGGGAAPSFASFIHVCKKLLVNCCPPYICNVGYSVAAWIDLLFNSNSPEVGRFCT